MRARKCTTNKFYGLDKKRHGAIWTSMPIARRLVERGVRFVQLIDGGAGKSEYRHVGCPRECEKNHTEHAAEVDHPIAGLFTDLQARGLLDSTLVVWQGQFGRMPISQRGVGRDHNPGAMSMWMAGAGIKGGQIIGASDEFGTKRTSSPSPSTISTRPSSTCWGWINKLTYRFNGRNMRLTDVYGELIPQIAKT